jgi:hypothetical protein
LLKGMALTTAYATEGNDNTATMHNQQQL